MVEDIEKFYIEDGCKRVVYQTGELKMKSFQASVRCCSLDGSKCSTPQNCSTSNLMDYNGAHALCASSGKRLCTKDELNTNMCCSTGGDCDRWLVWTSTRESGNFST